MRKFHDVYKEKQNKSIELLEGKVLKGFQDVYKVLLEKYDTYDFYALNEEEQNTFLSELNSYWTEDNGITDKGTKFLHTRSDVLSEGSTVLQKKNFLKNKTAKIVTETFRQSELKWKIYDTIDEMYNEVRAKNIGDVLSPDSIINIIKESIATSLDTFVKEMKYELISSTNDINEKKDPKAKVRNRGDIVFSAESKSVNDDKDHFPINSVAQARNALARVKQYESVPAWYNGSLTNLVKKVISAVKSKYPNIKVSD